MVLQHPFYEIPKTGCVIIQIIQKAFYVHSIKQLMVKWILPGYIDSGLLHYQVCPLYYEQPENMLQPVVIKSYHVRDMNIL